VDDLGHLLRLKQMIDAAAIRQATQESGQPLVLVFNRLLGSVRDLALKLGVEDEIDDYFHPLQEPPALEPGRPGTVRAWEAAGRAQAAAVEASLMLAMLGGWVDGLISEQTLDARIRAEAEARAEAEKKPPFGFSPEM
jgi:hypothetical protein